jgi:hypothetical protein
MSSLKSNNIQKSSVACGTKADLGVGFSYLS